MWISRDIDTDKVAKLKELGVNNFLTRLLAQRSVPIEETKAFLECKYENISHPHSLHDVDVGADIFCQAMLKKQSVGVIGDYDCDGVMSSVMIKELCQLFGRPCKVFLPSRFEHGYGLNAKTIKAYKEANPTPPHLLFVLDCGSNNFKEVEELKEYGVEKVIIIDHHLIDEDKMSKNADAFISWHLNDHLEMCAAGEVYHFIRGIRYLTKKVDPIEFLSYAAIGTVGDVSPIIGDNRIIVRHGLGPYALNHVGSFGLQAMLDKTRLSADNLSQEDVAFKFVPKINAAGRMSKPDVALNLFAEPDPDVAKKIAAYLIDQNNERKTLQKRIEDEAIQKVKDGNFKEGILVSDPSWNVGVVGIVASRLVDRFHKPAVVVGAVNGESKGSGRSVEGTNLKDILADCQDLFTKFGGHAMAAGVSIKPECINEAGAEFDKACQRYNQKHELQSGEKIHYFDACLKVKAITAKTASLIRNNLYPYNPVDNPVPVFKLSGVKILSTELREGANWKLLKFDIEKDGERLPFQLSMFTDKFGTEIGGRMADIYFSFPHSILSEEMSLNRLNIVDIDFAD